MRRNLKRQAKVPALKTKRIIALVRGQRRIGVRSVKPKSEMIAHLQSAIEIQTRIRELIKLAKEQGYLTFDDLNAQPKGLRTPR